MKLCIDNRERDRIPKFQAYINAGKSKILDGVELDNYGTSDFHTPDNLIGIEYKRDDFLKSMYEGLLDQQIHELKEHFQYPFLFIGYDGFEQMFAENLSANPEAIIGELASIVAREKVMYLFVGDLLVPMTVKIIDRFYDGKTPIKISNYMPMRNKLTKAKPSNDEVKRHIIADIPRVGHQRAQQLLEYYHNSLRSLGDAPLNDLANLQFGKKKIGEKLANTIKEILK